MKNSKNKIAFVALIALALGFVACSNPAGSSGRSIVVNTEPKFITITNLVTGGTPSEMHVVIGSVASGEGDYGATGNDVDIELKTLTTPAESWCDYGTFTVQFSCDMYGFDTKTKEITFDKATIEVDFWDLWDR
jgi:hypothetical protein